VRRAFLSTRLLFGGRTVSFNVLTAQNNCARYSICFCPWLNSTQSGKGKANKVSFDFGAELFEPGQLVA
jgi:hypothetical protein